MDFPSIGVAGLAMAGPLSRPYLNPIERYSLAGTVILVWPHYFETGATPRTTSVKSIVDPIKRKLGVGPIKRSELILLEMVQFLVMKPD